MTESRELSQKQALEWLLDAVAEVLCSCRYVEDQEEMLVGTSVLADLEDAYDILMSYRVEDATATEA